MFFGSLIRSGDNIIKSKAKNLFELNKKHCCNKNTLKINVIFLLWNLMMRRGFKGGEETDFLPNLTITCEDTQGYK